MRYEQITIKLKSLEQVQIEQMLFEHITLEYVNRKKKF